MALDPRSDLTILLRSGHQFVIRGVAKVDVFASCGCPDGHWTAPWLELGRAHERKRKKPSAKETPRAQRLREATRLPPVLLIISPHTNQASPFSPTKSWRGQPKHVRHSLERLPDILGVSATVERPKRPATRGCQYGVVCMPRGVGQILLGSLKLPCTVVAV